MGGSILACLTEFSGSEHGENRSDHAILIKSAGQGLIKNVLFSGQRAPRTLFAPNFLSHLHISLSVSSSTLQTKVNPSQQLLFALLSPFVYALLSPSLQTVWTQIRLLPMFINTSNFTTVAVFPLILFCICIFITLIANNKEQDQTAPNGSSLIRVHSVCFHGKFKHSGM